MFINAIVSCRYSSSQAFQINELAVLIFHFFLSERSTLPGFDYQQNVKPTTAKNCGERTTFWGSGKITDVPQRKVSSMVGKGSFLVIIYKSENKMFSRQHSYKELFKQCMLGLTLCATNNASIKDAKSAGN